jgi:hypothetical protein
MSSFIIIKAAMDAEERREKEEAHDKKMREDGYVRDLVQTNKSWCYTHTFRNLNKQKSGLMWCVISMFLMLATMNITVLMNIQLIWSLSFMAWFVMTFFVGISKYYNTENITSGKKEPPVHPDCIYLKTVHDPHYDWQWVKKEKK